MNIAEAGLRHDDGLTLNGRKLDGGDAILQVREALVTAGLTPPSDYRTILVEKGRTHLLMAEDKIVVADHPRGELRAFASDESSAFTVDEIEQVWGEQRMDTDEFLRIWPAPNGREWVLERKDEPDVVLRPGGSIEFGPNGVEHIVSRPSHGAAKILVTVATLSGVYPSEGGVRVSAEKPISTVLEKAAKVLGLTDTSAWVVSVGGRDVASSSTFSQAGLSGAVELDWMPREGGGGRA